MKEEGRGFCLTDLDLNSILVMRGRDRSDYLKLLRCTKIVDAVSSHQFQLLLFFNLFLIYFYNNKNAFFSFLSFKYLFIYLFFGFFCLFVWGLFVSLVR